MSDIEVKKENIYETITQRIVFFIALAIGLMHILNVSGVLLLSSTTIRCTHLMAMMTICFLNFKKGETRSTSNKISKIIYAILTIACSIYMLTRWESIANSGGVSTKLDAVFGLIMVLLVLEATRRRVGGVLSIICIVFLIYPFICKYLPGILQGRGYTFKRVFTFLFVTSDGLYGIPISVSAQYIVMFCIYGAFLSKFGAADFLFKFSSCITKKLSAATAKTSIVFAALVGMISGSAAGNVAISGTLTIPMMKQRGYDADKSGAISAVAATGGQIMPPVMGAAAFIMAELTGYPYLRIMQAAIIPSLLYYLALILVVHFEAKRDNIDQAGSNEDLHLKNVVKDGWYNLVPIILLIVMLVIGYSPIKSAYYSAISLVVVYFLAKIIKKESTKSVLKDTITKMINAIVDGAKDTSTMAVACAASGIIVGILSLSGLGSKLSTLIVTISNGKVFIALLLTMFVSIILGMGLPTTAAYLVLASVVVPALTKMGLPLLTAHMFVFFFGCISKITPPVALASYVAAGIAGGSLNRVGWLAVKYGLVSFVLPYMFVYGPSLLMEGSALTILLTVVASVIGVFGISIGIVGHFKAAISVPERIILILAGFCMVLEGLLTDLIGFAGIVAIVAINLMRKRKESETLGLS